MSHARHGPRRLGSLFPDETGTPAESRDVLIEGLTADSRSVRPGTIFAAIAGSKADGTRFIPQAVEAGAAAVLTGTSAPRGDLPVPVIRSADPRRSLALAAARFSADQPETVVAVTGTNGKTSVSVFEIGRASCRGRVERARGAG